MQPGERDDRVIAALKKTRAQGNAAKHLLHLYVAHFPCQ
jgi:hypothetical protein